MGVTFSRLTSLLLVAHAAMCSSCQCAGTVELFVQIFGAIFSEGGVLLGAHAFVFCGVATWLVTLLLLPCYKQESNRTGTKSSTANGRGYTALASGTATDSPSGFEGEQFGGEQQRDSMTSHDESSSKAALLGASPSVSVQR